MLQNWAAMLLIGVALCATGYIKGCQHGQAEHDLYVARLEADSAKLLNGVLQRNASLKAKYDADAKERDKTHANTIATIRARATAAASVKLFDPGQGCGDGKGTRTDGARNVESAATGRELSRTTVEFLLAEATRADETHAYAVTCHQWVNQKSIRAQVEKLRSNP